MILHQDGLIKLEYDPASDILEMEWPEFTKSTITQIEHSLQILRDTLRHYDIKFLLIDAQYSQNIIDDDTYKQLVYQFSQNIATTRLQKLARIESLNILREQKVKNLGQEIRAKINLEVNYQNFSNKTDAIYWLKNN